MGKDPLSYLGRGLDNTPRVKITQTAPTTAYNAGYKLGDIIVNSSTNLSYIMVGKTSSAGTWTEVTIDVNTDGTLTGADNSTVPSSLAVKTYADALAIAAAPVATTGTSGIGRLVSDANAVGRLASTGVQAYFVQPSNMTALMSAPGPIGDTTPSTIDCTDIVADGLLDLDTTVAAHMIVTGAADLTLRSTLGSVIINSEEAAADALKLLSAAGGLDCDVALQMNLASSQNAADAIVISASAGGIDITATGAPAEDLDLVCTSGSVNITAGESAADSIVITSSIGGIDIVAAGAAAGEDIDITSVGSSVNISASENAADAVTIVASAGGIDISATGTAGEDIDITATGSSVNLTSTEDAALAVYLHANGGVSETVDIHSDLGTGVASVNVHSDVGGLTFTSGLASADAININASDAAGGIDVDCGSAGFIVDATAGPVSLDGALASNFTITGATEDLTLQSSAGRVVVKGEEAAVSAVELVSAAGGISALSALQLSLISSEAAVADSVRIQASAADGGIDVDAGTGGIAVDTTGALSLQAAAASDYSVSGAGIDLTLTSAAGRVIVNGEEAAANAITLLSAAGGLDVDTALELNLTSSEAAATAISLTASNAAGGISLTSGTGGITHVGKAIYTPDAITAVSGGTAASVVTVVTEITTNGDSDLDNVTLANGVDGQVKIFAVVAVGNAADSIKITPASMIGGTQITFAANPLGLGCQFYYDAGAAGWICTGNNGGTIA